MRASARLRPALLIAIALVLVATGSLITALPAEAATISPVPRDDTGAESLAAAAVRDPGTLDGAGFVAVPPSGSPHAVSDRLSHFPTHGGTFALLTTGSAAIADQNNVSGSSGASLGGFPVRGNTDYDVTVLEVDLSVPAGTDCLRFDFAFYSEEFPEWVGTSFNDAFIAELDRSTWTTSGSSISAPDNFAFDTDGRPISINSTGPTGMNLTNAGGTTYDGATVLLEAATPVSPGAHTLYLSIFDQGDRVYDSAVFFDNIRFESAPTTCEPGAKQATKQPLIFIHGITGSHLQDADGDEVWPNEATTADRFNDEHLDVLRLADDGATYDGPDPAKGPVTVMPDAGIEGLIGLSKICLVGDLCYVAGDAYHTTFEYLEDDAGYTRGENLFPFAFDWRRSIDHNAELLLDEIDAVRQATGADRVNIVAHSQGGLVTSAALDDFRSVGKVDRVATLGTPYLGATKSLGVLDYAEPCQADVPLGLPGCFLNREKAQELAENWPGFLALLPSRAFFDAYHSPIHRQIDDDGDGLQEGFLRYDEVRDQLADRNLALIDDADALHQRIDTWAPADPEVELFRVVGDRSPTITRIIQFEEEHCSGILWWRDCELGESFQFSYGNGDGTVPLHSADLYRPAGGFDIRGTGQNAYAGVIGHGDLAKDPTVLDFVTGYLSGGGNVEAAAVTAMSAVGLSDEAHDALYAPPRGTAAASLSTMAAETQLRDEPVPLAGTEVLVRGPLEGLLTDQSGAELGLVDAEHGIEVSTIPGATYATSPSAASYFVTQPGTYAGRLVATADGELAVTTRTYANDAVTATVTTERVPVTAGAVVELALDLPTVLPGLVVGIDDDGDGTVDRTVPSGEVVTGDAAADTTAPVSSVTVEPTTGPEGTPHARVTIAATDEDGSGVARIEYALDATGETGVFTAPFEVPAVGELYVRAIDHAGNVEAPYQVVPLDDAPDRHELVSEWRTPPANLPGLLEHEHDVDWWGFELTGGRHQFQLIGLMSDATLSLRDTDGNVIAESDRPRNTSELITADLAPGRYHLVVSPAAGAWDGHHAYRLNVTRLGTG